MDDDREKAPVHPGLSRSGRLAADVGPKGETILSSAIEWGSTTAPFEPERHLTIGCDGIGKTFLGDVSSTYVVTPAGDGSRWSASLPAVGCFALRTGG